MLLISGCQMKVMGQTAQDIFGSTPEAKLARAAAEGDVDTVNALVKVGAKVNAIGKLNMTPLGWALAAPNTAGVRALLENGADANQRIGSKKDMPPVWLAAGLNDPEPLRLLLAHKGDPNALLPDEADYVPLARCKMKLENFKILVLAGADINVEDSIGEPLMMDVASLAQYDAVMFALQHGYNRNLPRLAWELNDRRPNGKAPLPPELEPKRLQVLEMLRKMGVTPPPGPAPALIPPSQ